MTADVSPILSTSPHGLLRRPGRESGEPTHPEQAFASAQGRVVWVDEAGRHAVTPSLGQAWDPERFSLLGSSEGPTLIWFAARGAPGGEPLREAALDPLMREVVTTATAITAWHGRQPACETCGGATSPTQGGFVRRCGDCGRLLFPRHDPAIIVAVLDPSNRLLLAHQASWPEGRVSVLAGFVEAGESLEQTCGREVAEEVGLQLQRVRYVTSQSWPFPRSLMLGFVAAAEGEPLPDGQEIQWASWFSSDEVDRAVADGSLTLPGPFSLGRALIDGWRRGELTRP